MEHDPTQLQHPLLRSLLLWHWSEGRVEKFNETKLKKHESNHKPWELTLGKVSRGTKCMTVVLPSGNCKTRTWKKEQISVKNIQQNRILQTRTSQRNIAMQEAALEDEPEYFGPRHCLILPLLGPIVENELCNVRGWVAWSIWKMKKVTLKILRQINQKHTKKWILLPALLLHKLAWSNADWSTENKKLVHKDSRISTKKSLPYPPELCLDSLWIMLVC